MHAEAHAGFGVMLERSGIDRFGSWNVLDLGGQNVNGTVYDWLPNSHFTVLDLHSSADIVADARVWDPDRTFDIVISTEMLEHVSGWQKIIGTSALALDPAGPGLFVLTAASTGRQPHGQTGEPAPAPGEHYGNVTSAELRETLRTFYGTVEVTYNPMPGDVYALALIRPLLDITIITPTLPERSGMLRRALASVHDQDHLASGIVVQVDEDARGAAATRNAALERVETTWTAFLDDDDELMPGHLLTLAREQLRTGADVIWPWFTVAGGTDPFPQHRGRQWNPEDPHLFPITCLVRTAALRDVGGFRLPEDIKDPNPTISGEDFDLWLRLSAAGAVFRHVPEVTWIWHHHGTNTSGLPRR